MGETVGNVSGGVVRQGNSERLQVCWGRSSQAEHRFLDAGDATDGDDRARWFLWRSACAEGDDLEDLLSGANLTRWQAMTTAQQADISAWLGSRAGV